MSSGVHRAFLEWPLLRRLNLRYRLVCPQSRSRSKVKSSSEGAVHRPRLHPSRARISERLEGSGQAAIMVEVVLDCHPFLFIGILLP